ncbi:MAG: DUF4880 domain-containing protein [Pseudomonadales bacterium]|mgnify:CR=1 FL=1|jgi:ferric-dicitrate binding protein FerR (iron transport regulator)
MNDLTASESLSDISIEWFVRLRADDVTEDKQKVFFEWLRQAREHQQSFVETLHLWDDLSVVKQMDFDELRSFPQIWEFKRKIEAEAAG